MRIRESWKNMGKKRKAFLIIGIVFMMIGILPGGQPNQSLIEITSNIISDFTNFGTKFALREDVFPTADSNIDYKDFGYHDQTPSIGNSQGTYTNAQSVNGIWQNLTEADTSPNRNGIIHNNVNENLPGVTISDIAVTNWGFESGDLTDWTVISGTGCNLGTANWVASTDSKHEGTYGAKCDTDTVGDGGEIAVDKYNLTDLGYASQVSAGNLVVNASVWVNVYQTGYTTSIGTISLKYYNSTNQLFSTSAQSVTTFGSWVKYTFIEGVPTDTWYIELDFYYYRGESSPAGLPKSAWIDEHYIEVSTGCGSYSDHTQMQSEDDTFNTLTECLASGKLATQEDNDVDNNTSDVDGAGDEGTENNFANAQGSAPDSSYMTLTEADTAGASDTENDVDNNTSDVDSSADCGTETSFANAQGSSLDSSYMNIQECEDIGGGGGVTLEDYIDTQTDVDSSADVGTHDVFNDMKASDNTYNNISEVIGSGGGITFPSQTVSTFSLDGTAFSIAIPSDVSGGILADDLLIIIAAHAESEDNDWSPVPPSGMDGTWVNELQVCNTPPSIPGVHVFYEFLSASESGSRTMTADFAGGMNGFAFVVRGVDTTTPLDVTLQTAICSATGEPDPPSITPSSDDTMILTVGIQDDTNAATCSSCDPSSYTNIGFLTGTGGSTGQNLYASYRILSGGSGSPENPSAYTAGANDEWAAITIALRPAAGSSDAQMDLEMQFINVPYWLGTHVLAIETGSFVGSENINVTYWSGSVWQSIATDLTASSWNNFTVTNNVTGSTFTIKFGGSTTSSDTVIDGWEIDSIILVSSGEGWFDYYVDNEDSDVDSVPDTGTLTSFANMQDISAGDAVLQETASAGAITVGNTVETPGSTATTGTQTMNLPTDAGAGDLRVCIVAGNADGTTPAAGTYTMTIPSGWTQIGTQTDTGAASSGILTIIYRFWQSGDGNTVGIDYGGASVWAASICTTYEGVDSGTPLDQTTPSFATGTGNAVSPTITTQTDGAYVIRAALQDGAPGWTDASIPASTTLLGTIVQNPPSNGQNVGGAYAEQVSAGSAGTATWSNGGTEEYVAATFALRPATGSSDYQLDQEVQFINLPLGLPIANLSIYGGTQGSEALRVFIYNTSSSSWDLLISDLQAGWNNVSIIGTGWYDSSSTITINFNDTTKTGDSSTQDSWNIDATIIYLANGGGINYLLDFEYQWTTVGVAGDDLNEVAIYTANFPTENIQVYLWGGSSWSSIGTINGNGWFNFTASWSSTITIRLVGATETDDSTQDDWDIDLILFHTVTNPNYSAYFEYQWTTAEYSNTTEIVAINAGTVPVSEDLQVWYWTGGGWSLLGTLTDSGWNNFTATGLTSATYTILLWGTVKTSDMTQDTWEIDLIMLHVEDPDTSNYEFDKEVQFTNTTLNGYYWKDLTHANAGGELGSTSGWTYFDFEPDINDQCETFSAVTTPKADLSYSMFCDVNGGAAPSTGFGEAFLEYDLTSYATEIDAGLAYANMTVDALRENDVSSDTAYVVFQFLNSTKNVIYRIDHSVAKDQVWRSYKSTNINIPTTTRYYRFYMNNTNPESTPEGLAIDLNSFEMKINKDYSDTYENMELTINTGSLDSEVLSVEIFNLTSSSWDFVVNLTSASSWVNTSLSMNYYSDNISFRFLDTEQSADHSQGTWQIDFFALHLWNNSEYQLDWEHQTTVKIPTECSVNCGNSPGTAYKFMMYYYIDGGTNDTYTINFWDYTKEQWYGLTAPMIALTQTSPGWQNQTISFVFESVFINQSDGEMTWRYTDDDRTDDTEASTLYIDYVGIFQWNQSIDLTETTASATAYPDGTDYAFVENPFDISINSGVDYDVQIRCYLDLSPCQLASPDIVIYFDTDSNPVGYTALTGTYQNMYVSQAYTVTNLQFWLWVNVPTPEPYQNLDFTIWVKWIEA